MELGARRPARAQARQVRNVGMAGDRTRRAHVDGDAGAGREVGAVRVDTDDSRDGERTAEVEVAVERRIGAEPIEHTWRRVVIGVAGEPGDQSESWQRRRAPELEEIAGRCGGPATDAAFDEVNRAAARLDGLKK